jgi:hypothetical protein
MVGNQKRVARASGEWRGEAYTSPKQKLRFYNVGDDFSFSCSDCDVDVAVARVDGQPSGELEWVLVKVQLFGIGVEVVDGQDQDDISRAGEAVVESGSLYGPGGGC